MASKKFYGGCSRIDEESKATSLYSDCDEFVCNNCGNEQARSSTTHRKVTNNKTNVVRRSNSSLLQLSRDCSIHPDQKAIFFCSQHDQVICASCVMECHQDCKSVISIEKAAKGVRDSTAMTDLERRMQDVDQITETIKEENSKCYPNKDILKQKLKAKVETVRQKINQHLDKIQAEMMKEIIQSLDQYEDEKDNTKDSLEIISENSRRWKNDIVSLKDHGSEVHLFQAIKYLDKQTHRQENQIQNLKTAIPSSIEFFPSAGVLNFEKVFPSLGYIGKIMSPVTSSEYKRQQSQVAVETENR